MHAAMALENSCRIERFPQAFDGLNGVDSYFATGVLDPENEDIIFAAGQIGSEPLVAKYEGDLMRLAWVHGL